MSTFIDDKSFFFILNGSFKFSWKLPSKYIGSLKGKNGNLTETHSNWEWDKDKKVSKI